jgi:hypothetical protein
MTQATHDNSSPSLDEFYLRYRSAPKRRISFELVAWGLGIALVSYMLFAAVAGIIYAG